MSETAPLSSAQLAAKESLAAAGITSISPSSKVLGWQFISLDAKAGQSEVEFDAQESFANPTGFVQGGFLAAMLDDVIGMLGFLKAGKDGVASTIDLHIHYLRPVRPGKVRVKAEITDKGRAVMFGQATLFDHRGKPAAKASASLAINKIRQAPVLPSRN